MDVQSVHGGDALGQTAKPQAVSGRAVPASASAPPGEPGRRAYLTLTGIARKFSVSERTAHKIVAEEWFPLPVSLFGGERRNRRWVEQEVDEAVAARAPRCAAKKEEPEQLKQVRDRRSTPAPEAA